MAEKLSAIVAGHLCLDIIPQITGITPEAFRAAFMPGHLIDVGPVALSTGGPVSNTGLALHKLGVPTQLMGKIGDDLFGQAVTQLVSAYDPRLVGGMVVDPQANTSYTVVINPPGVDRIFLHCHGANDTFSADDVRYDLLDDVGSFPFRLPALDEADARRRRHAGIVALPPRQSDRRDHLAGHGLPRQFLGRRPVAAHPGTDPAPRGHLPAQHRGDPRHAAPRDL